MVPAFFLSYAMMSAGRKIPYLILLLLLVQPVRAETLMDGLKAYDSGRYRQAAAVWSRLSEAGNADAQTALAGLFIAAPPGIEYSPVKAIALYRMASEKGDPIAQMNLGDLYAKGVGTDIDLGKAAFWFNLAAAAGYDWARARSREIENRLSDADRDEFRRLSSEWKTLRAK